ncbi:hypothetical protein [Rhizobium laguerreae]|uniref:Uncharacterized protein n=1 Tax=Rhizobium laguerreae TaxID=1076926 RepID=A0A7Y2R924_9HYPH|nr:hypothetical protein [Rhizobium laguerreae]NNH66629.1 hypothetical protein [Rhizobium laguerreae]
MKLAFGRIEIKPERDRQADELFNHLRRDSEADRPTAFLFSREMKPPQKIMSRLLAKMALETVALRFSAQPNLLDMLIEGDHWDRIRRWARVGDNFDNWPFSSRAVFPEETLMRHPTTGVWVQAGYSLDLFITKRRETFLAFILYGYEFVINVGGPSITGYEEWLEQQNQISPLIERLGLRVVADVLSKPTQTYLVGDPKIEAGIEFDRARGIEGI